MALTDLTTEVFLVLREAFFDARGAPLPFALPPKQNTQDDPLDRYVVSLLGQRLPGVRCVQAPGPLISPDMVILREEECNIVPALSLREDIHRIVGIEVKKLERARNGQIARPSGLDYNTTPPCGILRVYDADRQELDIPGFYLFVCQESAADSGFILSALALCDGNALNADFGLYLEITGERRKGIGLGTYGDGMNRTRPMLVFANPLGAPQFDHGITLLSRSPDLADTGKLGLVFEVGRSHAEQTEETRSETPAQTSLFYAYRQASNIPDGWEVVRYDDPFPKPAGRTSATQPRGKFRVQIRPLREAQTA